MFVRIDQALCVIELGPSYRSYVLRLRRPVTTTFKIWMRTLRVTSEVDRIQPAYIRGLVYLNEFDTLIYRRERKKKNLTSTDGKQSTLRAQGHVRRFLFGLSPKHIKNNRAFHNFYIFSP